MSMSEVTIVLSGWLLSPKREQTKRSLLGTYVLQDAASQWISTHDAKPDSAKRQRSDPSLLKLCIEGPSDRGMSMVECMPFQLVFQTSSVSSIIVKV